MRSSLVRTSAIGYAMLFALSLSVAYWQGRLGSLFLTGGWRQAMLEAAIGSGLAAAVLGFGRLARARFRWGRELDEEFRFLLPPLDVKGALVLAAASGLVEETFFRGILQPALGLVPASLAFGLLHYPVNRRMIPWTGIALAMGLVFGITYEATGSLLPVILAHALINFVELVRIGRSAAPAPSV